MIKIKKSIFRIIAMILGFFGISSTFVACYGVIGDNDEFTIEGTVLGDINGDGQNEVVPGIKVTVDDYYYDTAKTDITGHYSLSVPQLFYDNSAPIEISFEDIDGEKNGSFKTLKKTIQFTEDSSSDDVVFGKQIFTAYVNVTLEKDDSNKTQD